LAILAGFLRISLFEKDATITARSQVNFDASQKRFFCFLILRGLNSP
jgi:hypothetical protein